jgi:hypothetical protein
MRHPEDFFPYFNKEIGFVDTRSSTMPTLNGKGTVVGIRLHSVELRVGNVITQWYPLNSLSIQFIF